ncbi:MAG TPA: hypothetical protein VHZ78_00815 [Rhizomicrobium sp.]|jgi:hypothetical protein|nr:hypothetical protein [Rhizomicrobium sp.]
MSEQPSPEPSLADRKALAEIRKLEAETAALRQPSERKPINWLVVLGGLSGLAAVITAIGGVYFQGVLSDANVLLAQANAQQKLNDAEKKTNDADKATFAAQQLKDKLIAENLKLQGELDVKTQQIVLAQQQLGGFATKIGAASAATPGVAANTQLQNTASDLTSLAGQLSHGGKLVYLQFQGALPRETVRQFQTALNAQGYSAPGVERVSLKFQNQIKYFKASDQAFADKVGALAHKFFQEKCGQTVDFPSRFTAMASPPPQVEAWISLNCKTAK